MIYGQLLTVLTLVGGIVIPCIYALLSTRLFQELKNINQNLQPVTVLIDYESNSNQKSIRGYLPWCIVKGCFFHFSQNIWKKMQENGLQIRYQQDLAFTIKARKIAALAFVPGADIDRYFNDLSNIINHDLHPILDYLEDNYVGVFRMFRRGHDQRPRFSHEMWIAFDRVQNHLPRTNNSVEGWNSVFNRHVGRHHANIWKLISAIKKEEDISQVKLVHIQQGRAPPRPHPTYASQTRHLWITFEESRWRFLLVVPC